MRSRDLGELLEGMILEIIESIYKSTSTQSQHLVCSYIYTDSNLGGCICIGISDRLGGNAMDAYVRMQDWDSVAFMKDIAGGSYVVVYSMQQGVKAMIVRLCVCVFSSLRVHYSLLQMSSTLPSL